MLQSLLTETQRLAAAYQQKHKGLLQPINRNTKACCSLSTETQRLAAAYQQKHKGLLQPINRNTKACCSLSTETQRLAAAYQQKHKGLLQPINRNTKCLKTIRIPRYKDPFLGCFNRFSNTRIICVKHRPEIRR